MNPQLVDEIVEAALYDGYILYPYRPVSKKSRRQFSFGSVYPEAYSIAHEGGQPWKMQTECLLHCGTPRASLRVKVRFLHPIAREVARFDNPLGNLFDGEMLPPHKVVPAFHSGGKTHQAWQEVSEREIDSGWHEVASLAGAPYETLFTLSAANSRELILDEQGHVTGALLRREEEVQGVVEIAATPLDGDLYKISVRIFNSSPLTANSLENQRAVAMRTFASTHTILNVTEGEFISLMDTPPQMAVFAQTCKNTGTWPVLVGDEKKGEHDTILSSPIILYDYPLIGPESPGDSHDGVGIDEILAAAFTR